MIANRYKRLGLISEGAYGRVFRALDSETDDVIALKLLRQSAARSPLHLKRFEREAFIAHQLEHPNLVRVLDSGHCELGSKPQPYLALELVCGLPLGDLIDARGALSLRETVHILGQLLDGLGAIHAIGAIHRDLKPDNILVHAPLLERREVSPGGCIADRVGAPIISDPAWLDLTENLVQLTDLGLGKLLETDQSTAAKITDTGVAAGTVHYMSPEQVKGYADIDYRTDLYGVGMLLYRLLSGTPPFAGEPLMAVAHAQVYSPSPTLPEPFAEHPISWVYRQATNKKRSKRFQSAHEMAWHLRASVDPALRAQEPPTFDTPPKVRVAKFWKRILRR